MQSCVDAGPRHNLTKRLVVAEWLAEASVLLLLTGVLWSRGVPPCTLVWLPASLSDRLVLGSGFASDELSGSDRGALDGQVLLDGRTPTTALLPLRRASVVMGGYPVRSG